MVGTKNKEAVTPHVNQEKGCPMEVLALHPREGRWPQDRKERQQNPLKATEGTGGSWRS